MKVALVRIPKTSSVELDDVAQMYSQLYGVLSSGDFTQKLTGGNFLSLEIIKHGSDIDFYFITPIDYYNQVKNCFYSAYNDVDIADANDPLANASNLKVSELAYKNPPYYPIRTQENFSSDTLNILINYLNACPDSLAGAQIIISPRDNKWANEGQGLINKIKDSDDEDTQKHLYPDDLIQGIQKKIDKNAYNVKIRFFSEDEKNLKVLSSAYTQFNTRFNSYETSDSTNTDLKERKIYSLLDIFLKRKVSVLNTEELAVIFHLPGENVHSESINWLSSRIAEPPKNLPSEGLHLGDSTYRGAIKPVYQKTDDRRRHTYIIGQTGVGKSELLKYMVYQDIKAGKGVAFIDPHGSAVEDIVKTVPKERAEDVVYFNPGDKEKPIGLNVLDVDTEEEKHIIINSFIALLYKLYDPEKKGIVGPRLERTVRNVMLTSMSEKGNTLIEVLRLITDYEFAKSKIEKIDDPLVKRYWLDEIKRTSDFHKSETLGYFASKFDRFVTESTIRNIVGQKRSAIDFKSIMNNRKILLVNLSKGLLGEENSTFIGFLLISKILMSAMARFEEKKDIDDFYLYVDEFQNFSTQDFATILSEARKYKLNLIVANQFIGQLTPEIMKAVFGNVGTIMCFRVGVDDAEYLHEHFSESFEKSDLINPGVGEVFVKLLIDGKPSKPFSMKTSWDKMQKILRDEQIARGIKEYSRIRYGKDRIIIDYEIRSRTLVDVKEPKSGPGIRHSIKDSIRFP